MNHAKTTKVLPWGQNEELFIRELKTGYRFENLVAEALQKEGFMVEHPSLSIRSHIAEAPSYGGASDLLVNGRWIVEVKSRELSFTNPGDFPYENILVDTVKSMRQKSPRPHFVLCISQITRAMIVTPVSDSTMEQWSVSARSDRKRGLTDLFYEAPKHMWRDFPTFVRWLGKQT